MIDGRRLHRPLWIGPILMAAGAAAIVGIKLHPATSRSLWEDGALFFALGYDRCLPVLGFGCALAQAKPRWAAPSVVLLVLGLAWGLSSEDWLVSLAGNSAERWTLLLLITGPLSCLIAGITLVAPDRLRDAGLVPAALLLGAILGVAVKLNDPGLEDVRFASAAVVAALWLAAAVFLTWRLLERPWFRIAGRIFASWLIAIGLMLGGAMLAPRHAARVAPAPVEPPPATESAAPPEPGGSFPTLESPQLPPDSPDFDPLRQP
jgi:hypothetical protein